MESVHDDAGGSGGGEEGEEEEEKATALLWKPDEVVGGRSRLYAAGLGLEITVKHLSGVIGRLARPPDVLASTIDAILGQIDDGEERKQESKSNATRRTDGQGRTGRARHLRQPGGSNSSHHDTGYEFSQPVFCIMVHTQAKRTKGRGTPPRM